MKRMPPNASISWMAFKAVVIASSSPRASSTKVWMCRKPKSPLCWEARPARVSIFNAWVACCARLKITEPRYSRSSRARPWRRGKPREGDANERNRKHADRRPRQTTRARPQIGTDNRPARYKRSPLAFYCRRPDRPLSAVQGPIAGRLAKRPGDVRGRTPRLCGCARAGKGTYRCGDVYAPGNFYSSYANPRARLFLWAGFHHAAIILTKHAL